MTPDYDDSNRPDDGEQGSSGEPDSGEASPFYPDEKDFNLDKVAEPDAAVPFPDDSQFVPQNEGQV
jgi:hypothetical protein